jgi:uncharacterized protein YjbJ (UPF0337 family)
MNKDQVKGRVDQTVGKAKEAAGKLVGNERLQGEGLADQAKGKVQTVYGDSKEHAKDKAKKIIDKI